MPEDDRSLAALIVHYNPGQRPLRLTMAQHVRFLEASRHRHRVVYWNCAAQSPRWLRSLDFDLVVLHYSALSARWQDDFERFRRGIDWVADLPALRIAMPQDEYDGAAVLDEWLESLSVDAVMSVLHPRHWPKLYPRTRRQAAIERTLTGFVHDSAIRPFETLVPHGRRPFDVVYRARALPYRYGSIAQMKHRIGEVAQRRAEALGLRTDISTADASTKYGSAWMDFLESGRAVIGSESGVSSLDPRGSLRRAEISVLEANPHLDFEEFSAAMPAGWDDHRFTAISPRAFEAASAGCAQLLVEGDYSDVLEPGVHYVQIKSDLSDLDDALLAARDSRFTEQLARRAHRDLVLSGKYTYRSLAEHVERLTIQLPRHPHRSGLRRPGRLSAPAARAQSFLAGELLGRSYRFVHEQAPFLRSPIRATLRVGRFVLRRTEGIRRLIS